MRRPLMMRHAGDRFDRWLLWALIVVLAWAPLPLGSNRPVAWTFLALATAILLLAWSVRAAMSPARSSVTPDRLWPALAGFGLVLGVIDVQVLSFLPHSWYHPVWLEASAVLGPDMRGGISVDGHATGTATMRLLTYVGVFWLAVQLGRTRDGAPRIIQALAFIGLAYAIYGLFAYFSGLDVWLWWHRGAWGRVVTSTFVNRNHYATYAGLGLLCAAGLLTTSVARQLNSAPGRRRSFARVLFQTTGRGWWLIAAVVCLALALVMTASRAGFASSAIGLATLLRTLNLTGRISPRVVASGAALAVLLGVAVLAFGGDDLQTRLAGTHLEHENRFPMYARVVDAILDQPWLGTGYGTFEYAFPPYKASFDNVLWDHAHNTYLENALELGIPAATALVLAIGWLALRCAQSLPERRRNALYPCLGVAATVLVGLHALLDFSLEIPAVAVTYAAILGTAFGRAPIRARRARHRRRIGWRSRRYRFGVGLAALTAALLLALAIPRAGAKLTALPTMLAEWQMGAGHAPGPDTLARAIETGHAALAWSADPELWSTIGAAELLLAQRPDLPGEARQQGLVRAEQALSEALARAPANPVAWTQLAYAVLTLDGDPTIVSEALALSVLTGPNHATLLPLRSALAAGAWDRLGARTRALFASQFAQTMRVDPERLVDLVRRSAPAVRAVRAELKDDPVLLTEFDHILLILGRS